MKQIQRIRGSFALLSISAACSLVLLHPLLVCGQERPLQPTPTPAVPETIAQAQILSSAEGLALLLRDISARLISNSDFDRIAQTVSDREEEALAKSAETLATLDGTPTPNELGELDQYWRTLLESNLEQQDSLSKRAATLTNDIARLTAERQQWRTTLDQEKTAGTQTGTADRLRELLAEIEVLIKRASDQQQQVAVIQAKLVAQNSVAAGLVERLRRERRAFQKRLLERDSVPLWQWSARTSETELKENAVRPSSASYPFLGVRSLRDRSSILLTMSIVFALVLLASVSLRSQMPEPAEDAPSQAELRTLLRYPIAFSLLVTLIVGIVLGLWVPAWLLGLVGLALVFPVLRFLPPLIGQHWRPLLYLLAGSFVLTVIAYAVGPSLTRTREIDALFDFGVIAAFLWLTLRKGFRRAVNEHLWSRIVIRVARLWIILLAISFSANIYGYLRFAQILGRASVYSAFLGVVLFMCVRLSMITLNAALRTERARSLITVRMRRAVITKWAERILTTIAVLFWLRTTAEYFMIREPLNGVALAVLTWPIALGTLSFSLGTVLTVIAVLLVGFGFSTAVRFVLREEILSRVHLSRGLPELITTLIYYGLIIIVVVLAFGAAGVEFSRLTLLTGALGVGIGFGLQNIVNNFVSGLILQFERPIHVGDILEVGGLSGEVTRIGVRSSTIQTGQGAEVIVPNAELVASRVINWTLSSERRRVDIPVAVVHGTEPKRVIALLKRVASSNTAVMKDPAPVVLFQGLGENALGFELRFWAPDRTCYVELKSDVGLAVTEALRAEGIEVPSTQRDLYLRMIERAVQERFGGAVTVGGPDAQPNDGQQRKSDDRD